MLEWVNNNTIAVFFDDVPCVGIRYILPSHTDFEKKGIKKYPFILRKALEVKLFDKVKERSYGFKIPKDYCFDGASIPRFFWRLIGAPTDNKFLVAALIHDYLCENHNLVMNDRKFSTNVFNSLLEVSDVNRFQRFLMKNSVDFYQRFCGWNM